MKEFITFLDQRAGLLALIAGDSAIAHLLILSDQKEVKLGDQRRLADELLTEGQTPGQITRIPVNMVDIQVTWPFPPTIHKLKNFTYAKKKYFKDKSFSNQMYCTFSLWKVSSWDIFTHPNHST